MKTGGTSCEADCLWPMEQTCRETTCLKMWPHRAVLRGTMREPLCTGVHAFAGPEILENGGGQNLKEK